MAEKQEFAFSDEITDELLGGSEKIEAKPVSTFGFDVKSDKSDLVLIVENQRLYFKRYVLEDASPVFESMFEEKLQEGSRNELTIDGVKCSDFAEFLACIQPRKKQKISMDNVYRMLDLADRYTVDDLKERCEETLIHMLETSSFQARNVLEAFDKACQYGLKELKSCCLVKVGKERAVNVLSEESAAHGLPVDTRCELYETVLPELMSKAHVADFMMMTNPSIVRFTNVKGVRITSQFKTNAKHVFKVWNIDWEANISICRQHEWGEIYTVEKKIVLTNSKRSDDRLFSCQIGISYTIRNCHSKTDAISRNNYTVFNTRGNKPENINVTFDTGGKDITDKSLGFIKDGKYTVDVYFLVNEPVYS